MENDIPSAHRSLGSVSVAVLLEEASADKETPEQRVSRRETSDSWFGSGGAP